MLPDWFRRIAPIDLEHVAARDNGITVKRCMPFLDALSTGWILPLAAEVRLEIMDSGKTVDSGWEFDRTMVSNHSPHQITGHPSMPRPPCKFHNYWAIRTPPGWSCLFVPPLNRSNGVFEVVAGIVDTDTYAAHIHFPVLSRSVRTACTSSRRARHSCRSSLCAAPTPPSAAKFGPKPHEEAGERERVYRNTIAGTGWYRKVARAKR